MSAALPVYAGTIFLSAFLLFSIQPMFAKLVLPKLGGSPAVWSTAMVFFQAILLADMPRLTGWQAASAYVARP